MKENQDLLADLERRANPEKSRTFSAEQFTNGLNRLMNLTEALTARKEFTIKEPPLRISIVGTNGKGTTAFVLEQIFRNALKRTATKPPLTGLYTSPHLQHFTERIRIDGIPATLNELQQLFQEIQGLTGESAHRESFDSLTYFELLTLLAFLLFQRNKIPVQIFEAGLGGRLDATRIARSDVVILTAIGLDHMALLGNTRKQILQEKLGMINKEHCQMLFLPDQRYDRMLTDSSNLEIHSMQSMPGNVDYTRFASSYARFIYNTIRHYAGLKKPGLLFSVELPEIQSTELIPPPGRLEYRRVRGKTWIFDNAHNTAAIFRLLSDLRQKSEVHGSTMVILSIGQDRRPAPILRLIRRFGISSLVSIHGNGFLFMTPEYLRQWTGLDLTKISVHSAEALPGWLREYVDHTEYSTVLFMGSHRLYDLFDRESGAESLEHDERAN